MVRVAALPVGKNHHTGPLLADDARDLQPVLPSVLYASVGDIERVTPGGLQDLGRGFGFGFEPGGVGFRFERGPDRDGCSRWGDDYRPYAPYRFAPSPWRW